MGCGIAAVGFVLKCKSYNEARALFKTAMTSGRIVQMQSGGYLQKALQTVLGDNGRDYRICKRRRSSKTWWQEMPDQAIVGVRMYRGDRWYHYLVRDGDEWVDSLDEQMKKGEEEDSWSPQTRGRRWKKPPAEYTPVGSYLVPAGSRC